MKIADMHCDTMAYLYFLDKPSLKTSDGHLNTELMRMGGYALQNFALFMYRTGRPLYETCCAMLERFERELKKSSDLLAPAVSYEDIERNLKNGKISAVLTVEDGAAIEGELSRLEPLRDRGLRMISITWNYRNELGSPNLNADGDGDTSREGLTKTGIEAVGEMERLGIIPDVSHLSDAGFWDVVKYTKKPFAASHSNARSVCGHPRNLTDEMLRAVADRGGVVGLNFNGPFLGPEGSTFKAALRHIKHIFSVAGRDVMALGSDFDGIDCAGEFQNAGNMQRFIDALLKAGLHESDVERIAYKNLFDFYKETFVEKNKM